MCQLVDSAGWCCKLVEIHAWPLHCAQRLEGGMVLSTTRCVTTHNNSQANILVSNDLCAHLADFDLPTIVNAEHHTTPNASLISMSSEGSLISLLVVGPTGGWVQNYLIHIGLGSPIYSQRNNPTAMLLGWLYMRSVQMWSFLLFQ